MKRILTFSTIRVSKLNRLQLLAVCILLAVIGAVGVNNAYASGPISDDPPRPPDESGYKNGEQCNVPGIVINNSDHVILITGDTWENGKLVWKRFNLRPGENSLKYLCDTDYLASQHVAWQWADAFIVQPNWWSAYIFNMMVKCQNHIVNGVNSFRCQGIGWNWGAP